MKTRYSNLKSDFKVNFLKKVTTYWVNLDTHGSGFLRLIVSSLTMLNSDQLVELFYGSSDFISVFEVDNKLIFDVQNIEIIKSRTFTITTNNYIQGVTYYCNHCGRGSNPYIDLKSISIFWPTFTASTALESSWHVDCRLAHFCRFW